MFKTYIRQLKFIEDDSKAFIIRQITRMPDYYRFGINVLCFFYFLKLDPYKIKLFKKLIMSLSLVKSNE